MRGHAALQGPRPLLLARQDLVDGPVLPLVVRGLLLAAGAAAIAVLTDTDQALGPSLALVIVIAFGAVPLPGRGARVLQAQAEVTLLAFVIGSLPEVGQVFVPLLLLAVFTTGQRGGLALGAVGGLVGGVAWSLAVLSTSSYSELAEGLADPLLWTVVLVATGLLAGWVHRLRLEKETSSDNAYEEAFRLLSGLQSVARDLSVGLDPATLGTTLLDEVTSIAPRSECTLSVRSGEGRLAPLVASPEAGPVDDELTGTAWSTGTLSSRTGEGSTRVHAFPARIGSQVVAVLLVRSVGLSSADTARISRLVDRSGPRLAAALVFDEVRQLATVDERLRLAREIHDGVAQELASVGYMLDDLAGRVTDEAHDELLRLRSHVRDVVGELRMSIFDLRAGTDDTVGLGTALSEHVQRVGQQSQLVVHTVLDEQGDRLPAGVEVELLRIAQEAVTNVRRHAHASNMWVECTVDAPRAWLRVADDGVGLQPARPQSMGIRGMRERARRIGGELRVGERPGGGTEVEVSIGDWDEEGSA
ncbi:sensor histidine kinase [Aquipuribacter hungaricus]|uniref:Sensor histidine kinase n=1 Tax=Aquipuribacter hungaricus TaxID=545624 RepID=A0ABV7WEY3_9MICO